MMAAYGDLPSIRDTFEQASAALRQDLWRLAAEGPAEELALTTNTQPLMLTAGVAVYRAWIEAGGPRPALLAGHSLGEYSALVASGVMEFADAVRCVRIRAQAMQDAVPAGEGGMAALLGLDDADVVAACDTAKSVGVVEPANFNSPSQVVISGKRDAVERAIEIAKDKGAKRAVMLAMSIPAHSSLMRPAARILIDTLRKISLQEPQIPIVHNFDLRSHSTVPEILAALEGQVYSPVRWGDTIKTMVAQGVTHVAECGPGKVLAGLNKRIDSRVQSLALADGASLQQAISTLGAA